MTPETPCLAIRQNIHPALTDGHDVMTVEQRCPVFRYTQAQFFQASFLGVHATEAAFFFEAITAALGTDAVISLTDLES